MRWKAERWMKLRHMPTALAHDPGWVVRNAPQMFAHTFRGSSWRSFLGLEDARTVFNRYRSIRARERTYLDWPDPLDGERGSRRDAQRTMPTDGGQMLQRA